MRKDFKILIVDDKKEYCDVVSRVLEIKGYNSDIAYNGHDALQLLVKRKYDLVISDLFMPQMDGRELLHKIKELKIDTEVIIVTAYGSIEKAVETLKEGAYSYVTKGDAAEDLLNEIRNLYEKKKLEEENRILKNRLSLEDKMVESRSEKFKEVLDLAHRAAQSESNILILGESGSGKEVMAEYIHKNSSRKESAFMGFNCQSISDSILESELFGHEKGAFTGAVQKHIGLFESANGGTLFLDEIGGISANLQSKMLKTIEDKTIYRMGSMRMINVDFRLVSATNSNIQKEMEYDRFRKDLFYRLSTIVFELPPLRERRDDIPLFFDHFVKSFARDMKKEITYVDPEVPEALMNYHFPGNIRELKNIVERLMVLSENGRIQKNHLTDEVKCRGDNEYIADINVLNEVSLRDLRKDVEKQYIEYLINKYTNNLNKVAEVLEITRRQLFNKLVEYNLKK